MKALIYNKGISLINKAEPEIDTDYDVKIKIIYAGICGTDLQIVKGNQNINPNIVMGHEAVGEIVEVGNKITKFSLGDKVIVDPNQYCGKCYYCRKGLTNFCTSNGGLKIAGINTDGMFAEYFVCNEDYVYKIPKWMDCKLAVLVEPVACVLNNVRNAGILENDLVLVIGSGPMGIIAQALCKNKCKSLVAVDTSHYRYNMSKKIADQSIFIDTSQNKKRLYDNFEKKFDVIIDTVGNQVGNAVAMAERNARIIPMGMDASYEFNLRPIELINKGIKIIGGSEYNQLFIDTIEMLERHIDLGKIVTDIFSLEEYKEAFSKVLGYEYESKEKRNIEAMKVVFKI